MSSIPITLHRLNRHQKDIHYGGAQSDDSNVAPPDFLVDDIARAEWSRVFSALPRIGATAVARWTLLAGYCNAVARAVRAEQTLAAEGQYYETRNERGGLIRRRHPALRDAEQGWNCAQHLARQLGITGGATVAHGMSGQRRSLFK